MTDLAIMIEGQNGLTWKRWQRIVRTVEELGFAGLYRSDHYTNANPPDRESLELWVSLTWLAANTQRIAFGPLVTPFSFREPTMTARMAASVDDLSRGRLTLGLGAGWQEREHHNFGHDLLDIPGRFARFEEGLEVVTRLLQSDEPVGFEGDYYQLRDAILLPRPARPGGPPILIGGNGEQRTMPLAARYADEWNAVFLPPATYADLNSRLDELLVAEGRQPEDVMRSIMIGTAFGKDQASFDEKMKAYSLSPDELRERGLIVGAGDAVVEQVAAYAEAGAARIMLQWLALDDMDGLEALAATLLPHFP
ncbi:MAG: TIGR03560 family F420-dependent LLM class oxidoreductase [Anaerolineae bacterium]|nr:TIGR03560 family F420-dependent LLM class oxidoreductase [Anaerolineae bacterium]